MGESKRPRMTLHDLSHSQNVSPIKRRDQLNEQAVKSTECGRMNHSSVFSAGIKDSTGSTLQRDERMPMIVLAATEATVS